MNQARSQLDLQSSSGMTQKMRKRMAMSNKRSPAQLYVWLGQILVGSITELPNDRNLFVFDESYTENPDRPVLSLSFYDAEGRLDTNPVPMQMKVAPFFSNLLPEAELRQYVAQRAGVKSVRDLPLLQLLGEDLPGAVVVRAGSDGPPPEAYEENETPAKLADESQPLRFTRAWADHPSGGQRRSLDSEVAFRAVSARSGKRARDDAVRSCSWYRDGGDRTCSSRGNRKTAACLSEGQVQRAVGEAV
jgi:HipA-like protein